MIARPPIASIDTVLTVDGRVIVPMHRAFDVLLPETRRLAEREHLACEIDAAMAAKVRARIAIVLALRGRSAP